MKSMKRRLPQFSYYDRTGMERYLEKQAQMGWRLCKIKGLFWYFERIEPAKLHFAVTYLPAASAFDPEPTEAQKQFVDFCAHTGWQQAAYNGEMQVFYHTEENPVPIETDALIEIESIHRTMKKSVLPSMILLLLVGVMQLAMFISNWSRSRIQVLTQNTILFQGVTALALLIMSLVEIGGYFLWRYRARKAAETDGSFVETRGHQKMQWVLVTIVLVLFAGVLLSMTGRTAALTIFSLLYVLLIILLVRLVTWWLKKKKVSGEANKTLTMIAAVVLSVVMIGMLPFLSISGLFPERVPENAVAEAPLLPSDYFDVEKVAYDIDINQAHSLLLGRRTYYISPAQIGLESPGVVYVIYDTKFDWAYELSLNELLTDRNERSDQTDRAFMESYRLIDAADFGAQAAYRQYWGEQPIMNGSYIVCYENRIVLLRAATDLTGEQMRRISEKLKP